MRHKAIDALVREIQRVEGVRKIILFGSRARGDNTPHSDIDLAIAGNISPQDWRRIRQLADVEDDTIKTLLKIDLVNMASADEAILKSIEEEGMTLYECPTNGEGL